MIYEIYALVDNGAAQGSMSESELRNVTNAHPEAVLNEKPTSVSKFNFKEILR